VAYARAVTHIRLLANCATPPRAVALRPCNGAPPPLHPRGRTVTKKGYEHIGTDVPTEQKTLLN